MSIINGDCLAELPKLQENSIDLLVTDPPYGYSFMGKDWDKVVVSSDVWRQCLRVLKPGAFAFIMSSPRQDVLLQMQLNLKEAGFEIGFTSLYWCYLSGFPKAANVGKLVDKRNGRTQDAYKPFADYLKERRLAKGLSMNKIDEILGTNTAYSWWEGRLSGIQLPSKQYYLQLKEILELDDRFDELIEREEAEREVIGKGTAGLGKSERPAHDGGYKPDYNITVPATPQAKVLDGSYCGYNPKPAVEYIIVCMKPLNTKSYVDQALTNQKGITWLDNCKTNNRFPANLLVSENALGDKISPFFSLDSWANDKLPFLVVPKPSKKEKGEYNTHISVKPVKLMSYLITMGSRPNDVILDPFAGSGTTGIAALQLGRKFIGIEKEPEYCKIARKRLESYLTQSKLPIATTN